MKKHTEIYMRHFGYDTSDFIGCEVCGKKAVDIHHIINRGMGATKQLNDIVNLMAMCRECHVRYGDKKQYAEYLQRVHLHILHH